MADLTTLQALGPIEFTPNSRGILQEAPQGNIALAANAAQDLFNGANARPFSLQYCRIQNIGAGTVKVAIDEVASGAVFNVILAADTGAEAGNGGVFEVPGTWKVKRVSVVSVAGSSICVTTIVNPNYTRIEQ